MKPPSAISSQLLQSLYSSKSRIRLLAQATSRPWYSTQSWPSGKRVIWLVSCSRVVPSIPGKQLSSSLRNASQSSSRSSRTRIWRSKAPRLSLATSAPPHPTHPGGEEAALLVALGEAHQEFELRATLCLELPVGA